MSTRPSKKNVVKSVEVLSVNGEVSTVQVETPATPTENNQTRSQERQNAAMQNTAIVPVNGELRCVTLRKGSASVTNEMTQTALYIWASEFAGSAIKALRNLQHIPGLRREKMLAQRSGDIDYLYVLYSSPWTKTDKNGQTQPTKRFYLLTIDSDMNISLDGQDDMELSPDGSTIGGAYRPKTRSELLGDIQMYGNLDPETLTASMTGAGWKLHDKAKTLAQVFGDTRTRHDEPKLDK